MTEFHTPSHEPIAGRLAAEATGKPPPEELEAQVIDKTMHLADEADYRP